jgi:hypothetical protein
MNVVPLLRSVALTVAAVALLTWAPAAKADANLVQNGQFLNYNNSMIAPGGFVCYPAGPGCTSDVTDWSATCSSVGGCGTTGTPLSLLFAGSGGVDLNSTPGNSFFGGFDTAATDPPLGGNYIGDDGDPVFSSSIFQTIGGLNLGQTYALSFYQAAAQQAGSGGATTEQWQVSLGADTQFSTLMNNPSGGFTPWNLQTVTFTATSSSEVLNFLSVGGPSGLPPIVLLADVSLTPVPEPASLVLLGGMGGLLVIAMRRRRRA